ncbi:MAG: hypothetical protein IJL14_10355 [Selenomonadaceae bacterium]|nr:hypothetical protein [Selenomonadaceae bacterium]
MSRWKSFKFSFCSKALIVLLTAGYDMKSSLAVVVTLPFSATLKKILKL